MLKNSKDPKKDEKI